MSVDTTDARERPAMVDLAFAVDGGELPPAYRRLLADAVRARLPWLDDEAAAGIHRLKLAHGPAAQALLSGRTRLVLRVPRARVASALQLQGERLDLGGHALRVGRAQPRELQPWGTLYAHLVATAQADEASFMAEVQAALQAAGVGGRAISGRRHSWEAGTIEGYGLMVDALSAADAVTLLQRGLGGHRLLGCGIFVAHRSAAAVGAPA